MDDTALKHWTGEELLAELRRREREAPASRSGEREMAPTPRAAGRARELQHLSTAQVAKLAQDRQRLIYGVDDRKDIYQIKSSKVRRAADSVAALVKAHDLAWNADGGYTLATESYRNVNRLCGSEPFVSQPIACFCSGFLVAPDVIATAGHCVKGAADLSTIRFVFGFRMLDNDKARTEFTADDVYAGATVIGRQLTGDGPDWALVRLDRPVTGRAPLPVRRIGKIADAQSLYIGHPSGLPQKYAPGAKVRNNASKPFFVANLDTYGGNSGSPVFNATNGQVEGILVRGDNDFVSNGATFRWCVRQPDAVAKMSRAPRCGRGQ